MLQTELEALKAQVLKVNASFYRAFGTSDVALMGSVWSERFPVSCFHPASPVLLGRDRVLESWKHILQAAPHMRCDQPSVQFVGEVAIVTCYEANGDRPAHLAATNVFARESDGWHMVHHQAAPIASPIPKPSSSLLN